MRFCLVFLAACLALSFAQPERVHLRDVPTLLFSKDQITTSRRGQHYMQLKRVGGSAAVALENMVSKVICRNQGFDGLNVIWKCESELPYGLKLGNFEILCEGFSGPSDDHSLAGSCSFEYNLDYGHVGREPPEVFVPGPGLGIRVKDGYQQIGPFSTAFPPVSKPAGSPNPKSCSDWFGLRILSAFFGAIGYIFQIVGYAAFWLGVLLLIVVLLWFISLCLSLDVASHATGAVLPRPTYAFAPSRPYHSSRSRWAVFAADTCPRSPQPIYTQQHTDPLTHDFQMPAPSTHDPGSYGKSSNRQENHENQQVTQNSSTFGKSKNR